MLPARSRPPDIQLVTPVGLILERDGVVLDEGFFVPCFVAKEVDPELDEAFVVDQGENVVSLRNHGLAKPRGVIRGAYQDAQKTINAVVTPLSQEDSASLIPQQFLVMTLHRAAKIRDVFKRRVEEVAQWDESEALGWEGASGTC